MADTINPRKKSYVFPIACALVILAVIGVSVWAVKNVETKGNPFLDNVARQLPVDNLDATLVDTEQEAFISFSTLHNTVNTVDVFVDPQCPPCNQLHEMTGEQLAQRVASGNTTLNIHFMSFLDTSKKLTVENGYSHNAGGYIMDLARNGYVQQAWAVYNSLWGKPSERKSSDPLISSFNTEIFSMIPVDGDTPGTRSLSDYYDDAERSMESNTKILESGLDSVYTPATSVNGKFIDEPADVLTYLN